MQISVQTRAKTFKGKTRAVSCIVSPMSLHCPVSTEVLLVISAKQLRFRLRADVGTCSDLGPVYVEETVYSAGVPWGQLA